jgi:uncharacterized RDD family membrane protein YckC
VPSPVRQAQAAVAGAAAEPAPEIGESLFPLEPPKSKVIPFHLPGTDARPAPLSSAAAKNTSPRPAAARSDSQPALDFLHPPPHTPRTLKTSVEAVICCDAPVAPLLHRAIASGLDAAMILTGFGFFLATVRLLGGKLFLNQPTFMVLIASLVAISLLYGVLWMLAGRQTPGMRWTRLHLINFDGLPPEGRQRGIRFLGTCLSFCALGVGLLWAMFDEEGLTWHDHISQTFPTVWEPETNFFRRG